MEKCLFILIILVINSAFAADQVSKFAHWLPHVQADLFEMSNELAMNGIDTPEKIEAANEVALNEINKKTKEYKNSSGRKNINLAEAKDLLQRIKVDPVTTYDNHHLYDPTGRFGFCYGRAVWVWLEALRLGMSKESIKKIFLVGPMRAGNIDWQFHVATAVRVKTKGFFFDRETWYVIDPNFDRLMTLEEFYIHYKLSSTDNKLRLFVTDPQRLGPSSTIKFGPKHFRDPNNDKEYNAYFTDMISNYRNQVQFKKTNKCKFLFPTRSI